MNITLPREVVREIQGYISRMKEEHGILYNKVVREDVFGILQNQCTVLYYVLDDTIEGCHIFKPVNGKMQQFVFINTNKNVQEQVWTAAHELGHVWEVDKYIGGVFGEDYIKGGKAEYIVGRFAAEFLMPEDIFREEVDKKLKQFAYTGSRMQENMLMELIAFLMNFFCTPYKSVVRRFIELEYVNEADYKQYMSYEKSDLLMQVIKENQYSRLGKERPVFAIENFPKELQEAENRGILSEKKINKIRGLLHIEKQQSGGEKLEFKGHGNKPDDEGSN